MVSKKLQIKQLEQEIENEETEHAIWCGYKASECAVCSDLIYKKINQLNKLKSHLKGITKNRGVPERSNLAATNRPDDKQPDLTKTNKTLHAEGKMLASRTDGRNSSKQVKSRGTEDLTNGGLINEPTKVDSANKYSGIAIINCIQEELDNYNFDVINDYPKSNFVDTMKRINELMKGGGFTST